MPTSYVTIQGDTWDGIAKKTMGSEFYMSDLIESNLSHKEITIFPANITLVIPEISTPIPSTLPPWKRGVSS
ncbi:hypothetical protein [Desulforamulus reducens]|uniref:hypothetical protein n=1 Tax=Desulforamulus reducens TaxID=59610 RepID=UPI00059D0256|nr:hypothetical protein [Desulforamulus reducens]